ncbi:type I secretion C-terminal target domain-containing protein, partial [Litorilituus lipolyticus]
TPNDDFNGTDTFTYTNAEGNTATVTVTVNPENDAPVFKHPDGSDASSYTFNYNEHSSADHIIGTVEAVDVDGDNITYSIISGNDNNWFEIDSSGNISLTLYGAQAAANDYEIFDNIHHLVIGANDGTVTTEINVTLNEINLNDTLNISNAVSSDSDVRVNSDLDLANNITHIGSISGLLEDNLHIELQGQLGLTSNKADVTYQWDAASKTLTAQANGDVVFTIKISEDNSSYTFTQFAPIDHLGESAEQLTASFTAVIQDDNGKEYSKTSFDIVITDDNPETNSDDAISLSNVAGNEQSGILDDVVSNDLTSVEWDMGTLPTNLVFDGYPVTYIDNGNGTLTAMANGQAVFTITIDTSDLDDNGHPSYKIEMLNTLGKLGVIDSSTGSGTEIGGGNINQLILGFDSYLVNTLSGTGPDKNGQIVTQTVNSKNGYLAVGDQWIEANETLYMSFTQPGSDSSGEIRGLSFIVDGQGGPSETYTVIWTVTAAIDEHGNTVTYSGTFNGSGDSNFSIPTTYIDANGLEQSVLYFTDLSIQQSGNTGFRIGISGVEANNYIDDIEGLNFGYSLVDADGDKSDGNLVVDLTNDNAPIAVDDGGPSETVWGNNLVNNGDADSGSLSAWSVSNGTLLSEEYGSFINENPNTANGEYFLAQGDHVVASQTISLNNEVRFKLSADLGSRLTDTAELKVVFKDVNGNIVGEFTTDPKTQLNFMQWFELTGDIPANAVSATIEMHMYDNNSDGWAEGFFDNVSFVTGEISAEYTTAEDAAITVDVLNNDYDLDGDAIYITQIAGQNVSEGDSVEIKQNGVVVGLASLVGGKIVFVPSQALQLLNDGESTEVNFAYTISDQSSSGNNQTDSASVTILVTGSNDAPILSSLDDGEVYEHGLVDGNTNSGTEFTSGSFFIQGGDITGLEIAGQSISLTDLASNAISVNTGKGVISITDFNTSTGELSYTYQLSSALKHNSGDIINDTITVRATNNLGTINASFNIAIHDDSPSLSGGSQNIIFGEQITNVIIVLDASGSMARDMNGNSIASGDTTTQSRMDIAIAAIKQLIEAYDDLGSVNVQLVSFSSSSSSYTNAATNGWLNLADAKAWLDNIENTTANGGTDYVLGLQTAMNNFVPPNNSGQTYSYFISDGEPYNDQNKADALAFEDDWELFLANNNINESYAIGMGNVPTQYLDIAAHADGEDTNTTLVYSASDMANHLLNTVNIEKTGSLLIDIETGNNIIGADSDGASLTSIVIDGKTYYASDATNGLLTIITAKGGELSVNFNDNTYSYLAKGNSNGSQDYIESFYVNLIDGDGDVASAEFSINVGFPSHSENSDDTDVLYGSEGADTFMGYGGDDVLIGLSGHDTLNGGLGDDLLMGGSGDDVLIGGAGNDKLRGSSGSDTFYFGSDSADNSIDTIVDFENGDTLDLSDLLEGESATADNLAEYLQFSFDGTDTVISIDKDKDGSTDLTIKLSGIDLLEGSHDDAAVIQKLLDEAKLTAG